MKKLRLLAGIIALILISSLLLTSCQNQNDDDVLSHIGSSEITSSDTATSEPEKDVSSPKPEESSKSEEASKPAVSSKPQITSKPTVSSKPAPTPSQNSSKVTSQTKPDSERIAGKWEATIDIAKDLKKQGFEVSSPAMVKVSYEFSASNNAVITIDEESYRITMRPYLELALRNNIANRFGVTLEEYAAQNNTTADELIDASMKEAIKNLSQVYAYKFENSLLWMNNTHTLETEIYRYSFINDDKLSLTFTADNDTAVFTRVK